MRPAIRILSPKANIKEKNVNCNRSFFLLFFLVLLTTAFLSSCKKSPQSDNQNSPGIDLGSFGATEEGPGLTNYYQNRDTTKISGYTNKRSYFPGDTVQLFLSGPKFTGQFTIWDMNFNKIFSAFANVSQQKIAFEKPWVDGFGYKPSVSFVLPADIKSGVYRCFQVYFIVKSKINSDVSIVYPTNTINAYCESGGKSLYHPQGGRAFVASFLRDQYYSFRSYSQGFIEWIQKQNYDVNFISDEDLDDYKSIENSKVIIIIGHSEYWTRKARENFDKFVESGKNALVLAGNLMWWQVRYNKEKDVMICYKQSSLDPLLNTPYDTKLWNTPYLNYPITKSAGNDYTFAGYGRENGYRVNDAFKIIRDHSPLLAGTNLKNGDTLGFPENECDGSILLHQVTANSNEMPELDIAKLGVYKAEIVAYFHTFNKDFSNYNPGTATFLVFQKTPTSGTIVNTGSETWCDQGFHQSSSKKYVETITKNMIERCLKGENLFSK